MNSLGTSKKLCYKHFLTSFTLCVAKIIRFVLSTVHQQRREGLICFFLIELCFGHTASAALPLTPGIAKNAVFCTSKQRT